MTLYCFLEEDSGQESSQASWSISYYRCFKLVGEFENRCEPSLEYMIDNLIIIVLIFSGKVKHHYLRKMSCVFLVQHHFMECQLWEAIISQSLVEQA